MTSPIELRTSVQDDDRDLARINAAGWPEEVQVVPPEPADQPFFTARRKPEDVLVAIVDSQIAGFAHLDRHIPIEKNAHVLHLNALVVDSDYQGRGIGHHLVDAAIAEARERGFRKIGLRAMSNNGVATRLYERHGFQLEGRVREEFLQADGSYSDDLWYGLFL